MKAGSVLYKKKDHVGLITLNRPKSRNAINAQMVAELSDIRNEINADSETRVVVLTGKGAKFFCMGTESTELSSTEDRAKLMERLSIASCIYKIDLPVISAINGDATGQGLELALACDLRICTKSARFAMPHVTLGEIPWDGGTQRLSRLVGKGKAMEMILLGETIGSREALRIGLVHRVVEPKSLLREAMSMAKGLAQKSPIALRFVKEAICKGLDLTLWQGLRLEADLYFLLHTTHDRTEGINAFREKRPPRFEGR